MKLHCIPWSDAWCFYSSKYSSIRYNNKTYHVCWSRYSCHQLYQWNVSNWIYRIPCRRPSESHCQQCEGHWRHPDVWPLVRNCHSPLTNACQPVCKMDVVSRIVMGVLEEKNKKIKISVKKNFKEVTNKQHEP